MKKASTHQVYLSSTFPTRSKIILFTGTLDECNAEIHQPNYVCSGIEKVGA